ncbi:MAG TPA: class I SAM-dependent methyltransferase [Candidatus Acidoferrum sp.]|jgi:2-polyprenyl-6-hydroxyphenyl methylase/3-demethylubiquinone-9 3-methyltransferase
MDHNECKFQKKMWDREYATGFGSQLKLSDARAHNEMLVEFMTNVDKNKAILDVGCGEGLLVDFLHECGYEHYLGFDFSDVALQNAAKRADAKTVFTKGFIKSFVPDGHFDAIVFNECLYWFSEPLKMLRRYERFLADGGAILVSLFTMNEKSRALDAEIASQFNVIRSEKITNATGTWSCSMIKKDHDRATSE